MQKITHKPKPTVIGKNHSHVCIFSCTVIVYKNRKAQKNSHNLPS